MTTKLANLFENQAFTFSRLSSQHPTMEFSCFLVENFVDNILVDCFKP